MRSMHHWRIERYRPQDVQKIILKVPTCLKLPSYSHVRPLDTFVRSAYAYIYTPVGKCVGLSVHFHYYFCWCSVVS